MSGRDVVLTYHRVSCGPDPLLQRVSPDHFAEQLDHVARVADVVPLRTLDRPSARARLAITFDDGYADVAETAAPLLQARGLPATFFVPSRIVDDPAEFWWDRLEHLLAAPAVPALELEVAGRRLYADVRSEPARQRALKALNRRLRTQPPEVIAAAFDALQPQVQEQPEPQGPGGDTGSGGAPCEEHALLSISQLRHLASDPLFEVGSHAATHTMLSSLGWERQHAELRSARERLAEVTGRAVTSLAYPYGTPESVTAETVRAVRRCGYERAFVNTPPRRRPHSRLGRPRYMVYDWTAAELDARLQRWLDS